MSKNENVKTIIKKGKKKLFELGQLLLKSMMNWLPKVCFGDAFVYRFFGRLLWCLGALYCSSLQEIFDGLRCLDVRFVDGS